MLFAVQCDDTYGCAANYNSQSTTISSLHIAHGPTKVHSQNRWPTVAEEGNNWLGRVTTLTRENVNVVNLG